MKTVDRKIKKTGRPYARDKRQKSQWSTYPTEKKYNNKNYCWSHGYDPSDPHTSKTCTSTQYGHIQESMQRNPMGGSQNNNARLWRKF